MPKKPPLYPHVPKGQFGAFICGQCPARFHSAEELDKHLEKEHPEAFASVARAEADASVSRMEVRLWTGTRIPVSDREEAVRVIKRELEGWREEGDRIVWYKKQETDPLPNIAHVMDSVGELTDASAIIVSKGEGGIAPLAEQGAKYYYCDNTRLHSNNEVIQIKTEEEDPKCPYCGAVMTYGRYWGPLLATQL